MTSLSKKSSEQLESPGRGETLPACTSTKPRRRLQNEVIPLFYDTRFGRSNGIAAAEEVEKEIQGENKYNVGWDLVRLAPPYVCSPPLLLIKHLHELLGLWRKRI